MGKLTPLAHENTMGLLELGGLPVAFLVNPSLAVGALQALVDVVYEPLEAESTVVHIEVPDHPRHEGRDW